MAAPVSFSRWLAGVNFEADGICLDSELSEFATDSESV